MGGGYRSQCNILFPVYNLFKLAANTHKRLFACKAPKIVERLHSGMKNDKKRR